MNDESLMPFGKYKGRKLIDTPASYLIWLYENAKVFGELQRYIEENLDALKLELKE